MWTCVWLHQERQNTFVPMRLPTWRERGECTTSYDSVCNEWWVFILLRVLLFRVWWLHLQKRNNWCVCVCVCVCVYLWVRQNTGVGISSVIKRCWVWFLHWCCCFLELETLLTLLQSTQLNKWGPGGLAGVNWGRVALGSVSWTVLLWITRPAPGRFFCTRP